MRYLALTDIIGNINHVDVRAKKGDEIELGEFQAIVLLRNGSVKELLDVIVELEEEPEAPKPKKRGRKKKDS